MNQYKFENPHNLTPRQLWLLATSAMLTQLNLQRHDTLFPWGDANFPEMQEDIKLCLSRDWDIKNLEGLSETLDYLHNKQTFAVDQNHWELLSNSEFKSLSTIDNLGSNKNILDMVQSYQFSLSNSDYGWHYGRCSWLIRMAAFVNYISEAEAWALLEENGERIKSSFDSWEAFGLSYMVGAQYWKRDIYTEASIRKYKGHFLYLLTSENSPWRNVAWKSEA